MDARNTSRNSPKKDLEGIIGADGGNNALQSFTENEKRVEEGTANRGQSTEKKSAKRKNKMRSSKLSSGSHQALSKNHPTPDRISNPFNSYRKGSPKVSPKSNSKILSVNGSPISYTNMIKKSNEKIQEVPESAN